MVHPSGYEFMKAKKQAEEHYIVLYRQKWQLSLYITINMIQMLGF